MYRRLYARARARTCPFVRARITLYVACLYGSLSRANIINSRRESRTVEDSYGRDGQRPLRRRSTDAGVTRAPRDRNRTGAFSKRNRKYSVFTV